MTNHQPLNESQILEMARELRYAWTDQFPFPNRVVNDGNYKCRNNWFQSVFLAVGEAERLGYLAEMTKAFNGHVINYFYKTNLPIRLKKPKDIRLGNYLLDLTIHDLEELLCINPWGEA